MYQIMQGRFKNQTFTEKDVVKEIDEHNMLIRLSKSVVQISDSDVRVIEDEPVEPVKQEQQEQDDVSNEQTGQPPISN